ncbi:MAG: LLM class flavin-dependent oxidoreductase, partial [Pseudonocardiales bacterium]|nr:LLM class flavin-dependent oxidoreductase [Pseudonocardiales bacterium]
MSVMQVGIGLPNQVGGVDGPTLLEFARRAERHQFSTVYVNDRLVWSSYEPLSVLVAVAGVTASIGLTGVVVAPLRANHALFASTIASVDGLAGPGRLRVALATGVRSDEFDRSGLDFADRGRQLDALVAELRRSWGPDSDVGPRPATPGGPPLLFAATSAPALRRIVGAGQGWLANPGIDEFRRFVPLLLKRWAGAGRAGVPYCGGTHRYALGPEAEKTMKRVTREFFHFASAALTEQMIADTATSDSAIRAVVAEYKAAGCDELIFLCQHTDPDQ